ncbi:hypothetical protein HPB49_022575 [Dermacentor silvarum]|uniref:Uncharacterized protein n=1 Tax=Dermacentor silvarum TaxID=543639 RepID=A0ACB8D8G8_DERSI|nr:hypothetical protein HPB49_022575 [Dermacentor silvarum]
MAVVAGNCELVELLLGVGADINATDKDGDTPMHMSLAMRSDLLVQSLSPLQAPAITAVATAVASTTSAVDAENAVSNRRICKICLEADAEVWFEPCGHHLYCSECCRRMKRCLECSVPITGRVSVSERLGSSTEAGRQAQRELEARLQQLEEVHSCGICMERQRNVVFLCGHGACDLCAADLQNCHMCRETLTKKIKVY